ncbi:MAG: flagellar hook-associated protein FlgL [Alcaligenaceae bacterium]|nr:flagellar hook-associated protein FlgL [Alcaligenaceae bacterium]
MRISSSLFFQTGVNTINSQQAGLMKLYQQIGTGKRMINPSDDPLAAAQTINIAQSQTMNLRYTENRQVAKSALSSEENTLTSVTSLLTSIKTRLVEAGNGTLSDADRAVLGNVLSNARDNLLGLANSTDGNGQYLFSGHKGTQPPFVEGADGKIVYQGDDGRRKIQVDQTRQLDAADTGRELFMQAATGTRNYVTSAGAANTGNAVVGAPIITDSQGSYIGDAFQVSFADDAGVLKYSITRIDGDGNAIDPASSPVAFTDTTSAIDVFGQAQFKISGSPAAGDVFRIEPAFMPNTHVVSTDTATDFPDAVVGKPIVYSASGDHAGLRLQVEFTEPTPGNFEYRVVNADNPTEVLKALTALDSPDLDGGRLSLGGDMAVEFSGTPTITAPATTSSFVVEPVDGNPIADLNVFDALDNLIAVLNDPAASDPAKAADFRNQLNATMQRVDVTYNQVLTVRSSVGTRLNEIQSIDDNASLRNLSYAQELIRLEDLDWYEATAQLQQQTAALEAASLAFKQIQATSLFRISNG